MDIVRVFKLKANNFPINIRGDFENPLFQATHVGKVFGISKIRNTVKDFDDDERVTLQIDVNNPYDDVDDDPTVNKQDTIFLTEQGVLRLIFSSRKEEAKLFKKWVSQVIKEVLRNGRYEYEQNALQKVELNARLSIEANKKVIKKERHQSLLRAYEKNFIVYLIELEDFTPKYKDQTNPNDTSRIIKIGSTKNIRVRLDGLTQTFGECTLLDCYKCACYEDFETYLFQHEFIKPHFISVVEGKRETYKFDDDTYDKVLDIIRSDIKNFNNISHEEVVERMRRETDLALAAYKYKLAKQEVLKAEQERLKAEHDLLKANCEAVNIKIIKKAETERLREARKKKIVEYTNKYSNNDKILDILHHYMQLETANVTSFNNLEEPTIEQELNQYRPHQQASDNIEKDESNQAIIQSAIESDEDSELEAELEARLENLKDEDIADEPPVQNNINVYENLMEVIYPIQSKNCKGPLVQQYDPNTLQLIKTFDSFIDVNREVNGTSAAAIRAAIKANSVYYGFRWFSIARDANPIQHEIPPTIDIQQAKRGLIAMLNLDRTHILQVYDSVKSASKDQQFTNGAAISKAINSDTKSGNKYWKRWEDCSAELRTEYLEHNKLPEVLQVASGSVKVNQYHPVTNEFVKTFNSMSDITKEYQMSRASLIKAITKQRPYKGFIWNYLNAPPAAAV